MLLYYYHGPANDGAFREIAAPITGAFPDSAPIARYVAGMALPSQRDRLDAVASEMEQTFTPSFSFSPPPWLKIVGRQVHFWFLPATLVGTTCAAIALLRPRLRARRELAALAWLCLCSIGVLFAQVLTLAMVTVTEGRYADALRTLAVFSLACAVATSFALAIEVPLRRKSSRTGT